ncbi:MAG: Cu(I)/Ag(I) efflux system membrane fusion protein [Paraglaciecola sp.]|jgi:Cu(I)/Ag(I) efflux system membrane fusion protein
MQINKKIIGTAIVAVIIGLGLGYLIFGNQNTRKPLTENHQHGMEKEASPIPNAEEIWTCSMHPQIRQPESGDCAICGMDLILLEENTSDDPLVLQMTKSAVKLANIQTTTVGKSTIETGSTMRLSGKVQADERRASSQVAHVAGRIEKLYVTFTSEQVNKGQKLAEIYSPDLISAQRELLEALKLQDLNPDLVEATRKKLRYLKISNSTIQNIEDKGSIQETFTLYADASGIVSDRKVSVGDYIAKGEPLFHLMNLSQVWVLFDAYEEALGHIKKGDKIEFTTPSISNKTFTTSITFIDPIIDPMTRVVSLRTEVRNSSRLLKPEMLVYGILKNKGLQNKTLTVPKSAVLWTGKRSVVYVKVPDTEIPSYQFREVQLGEGTGNGYPIMSGLEAGEQVVTNGSFTIDAAAQLNNQASMMNRNVTIKKEKVGIPNFQKETPDVFKKQLNEVTNAYIQLKDALVATDGRKAIPTAEIVVARIDMVDMKLLKGDAHIYWMEQLDALQAHSQKITKIEDIEEQRKQFGFLSTALINSIEAFGTIGNAFYVQHCPMAFGNEGADWLAVEEAIQNPYFGDKMMKCGLVKKTFSNE